MGQLFFGGVERFLTVIFHTRTMIMSQVANKSSMKHVHFAWIVTISYSVFAMCLSFSSVTSHKSRDLMGSFEIWWLPWKSWQVSSHFIFSRFLCSRFYYLPFLGVEAEGQRSITTEVPKPWSGWVKTQPKQFAFSGPHACPCIAVCLEREL